jgi:hypothetical protein
MQHVGRMSQHVSESAVSSCQQHRILNLFIAGHTMIVGCCAAAS